MRSCVKCVLVAVTYMFLLSSLGNYYVAEDDMIT
jgi:hypothetical protein